MLIKPGTPFRRRSGILFAVGMLAVALAGCGGGGGSAPPPPVTVSIGAPVGVGNSPISKISFPIVLSGPAYNTLTISYATTDENAVGGADCNVAGADYVKTANGTLSILPGASSGTLDVQVCDPTAFASAAALKLTLTGVTGNGQLSGSAQTAYGLIAASSTGTLNDTGATQCSDGASLTTCPLTALPGQDASSGRDVGTLTSSDADGRKGFAFAKVAGDKSVLAASTTPWSCVQDNVTGLTWEAKTDANKADSMTSAAASAHVTTVNTALLCGYNDWRLPTPQELASLVDNSVVRSPTSTAVIDQTFFAEQQKNTYWSATSAAATGAATGVWAVDFQYGMMVIEEATASKHVRLVRGAAAAPNYAAPENQTVKDQTTGLMWRQCADGLSDDGCATGAALTYTWQEALNRVNTLNQTGFAGYKDWRLPNRNELASIVEYSRNNPALNTARFVGFPLINGVAPNFWTSTPYATDPTKAWSVGFKDGEVAFTAVTNPRYILLVRGGQ